MSKPLDIVFLFDVDNTLIDNDRVQADLKEHLEQAYGAAARDRYWEILEKLQNELGYIDYLGALERFRIEQFIAQTSYACRAGSSIIRSPNACIPVL